MIYFNNDYSEGCHPKILEALARTNLEQTFGYGEDEYCARAAEKSAPSAAGQMRQYTSWLAAHRPT